MFCRVCSLDIDDYYGHVSSDKHMQKYKGEIDLSDGESFVKKLDTMFDEMEQAIIVDKQIVQNEE